MVEPGNNAPTLIDDAGAPAAPSAAASMPTWIGPYRILAVLGEGGFGIVYLAEQRQPLLRRVALKVLKPGMDSAAVLTRFDAERQALAVMDHPWVATVFDGGSTAQGLPYFAMEHVDGQPVVAFCDHHRLDVGERLALFVRICRAVQHAHIKGVIHRDLKPSNILVHCTDGGDPRRDAVPKVIDFGIAKAVHAQPPGSHHTALGQWLGTPEYMSPEQVEGTDIDTRADIYSLGVILHELLTGRTPLAAQQPVDRSRHAIERAIRELDPGRPSACSLDAGVAEARRSDPRALGRLLRGDLDGIVLKALARDRAQRYDSAGALADDISRHLRHQPVQAAAPGWFAVAGKFVRRHRLPVAAAGTLCAAALVSITGIALALAEATRQRERAEIAHEHARSRAEQLETITRFQASQLAGIDTAAMGMQLRTELLARLAQPDDAAAAAAIESVLDDINFTSLALGALDEHVFRRALQAIDDELGEQPLLRARLLQTVASTTLELGLLPRALQAQQDALALRRALLGTHHPDTLESMLEAGRIATDRGDLDAAEALFAEAIDASHAALGGGHELSLSARAGAARVLQERGHFAEAERALREVLDGRRRVLGDLHRDTLGTLSNLGYLLDVTDRADEAEPLYAEALAGLIATLGERDARTMALMHRMGLLQRGRGDNAAAEPWLRRALELRRSVQGDEHPTTLVSVNNLGLLLRDVGDPVEAEALLAEALATRRRVLGSAHLDTLASINNVALMRWQLGRLDEAERLLREGVATSLRHLGPGHPHSARADTSLGVFLRIHGQAGEAIPLLERATRARSALFGDSHQETLRSRSDYAAALAAVGRLDEAETVAAATLESAARVLPHGHPLLALVQSNAADALLTRDRFAEAEALLLAAHPVLAAGLGPSSPRTIECAQRLQRLYAGWHRASANHDHALQATAWSAWLADSRGPIPGRKR